MNDKTPGTLWFVIGPSGAGKDTLIALARERLQGSDTLFAHRYITRPADAGGENHVALSNAEFCARECRGSFALAWRRNGLAYGVGAEVCDWLEKGLDVVVNGSRAALPAARAHFATLVPVFVTASPDVLAERLAKRGREDEVAITKRLAEAGAFTPPCDARVIANDGAPEAGGAALFALLSRG
ncbi:phosphonate metabolism protein/1,5-bisphosphokinase (PRPP-forming) PhnN [Crenobacter cavernae]|uniref:Ribose 1,5-bisphosphate phosphokinase PhnN n=1 Tax=Crenobacter cavernae TaxID=2290923 RepID=A0ABY0FGZ4_9NEIS|nr:phosphonate metabolism protein/1,5-bisphosphokinase (PRPP-forming) PhnN [Crenobacter cavernae]RXZ45666.1 phosphonate metabolism protein/1,5-bisphosphokinase (PRPP-forming) PhnN [Crenobacter cavernae]